MEKLLFRNIIAEGTKIQTILDEDCDPIRYIKEVTEFQNKQIENKDINMMNLVDNLAMGYIYNGEANRAIHLLEDLLKRDTNEYDVIISASAKMTLCAAYLWEGDLDAAKKYYEKMELDRDRAKLDKLEDAVISIEAFLRALDARISYEEGRYEESLRFFERLLDELSNKSGTVMVHFRLALIYEKLGNTEKEKEHLEYVSENGNLLYVARLAREKLGLPPLPLPEIASDNTAASSGK